MDGSGGISAEDLQDTLGHLRLDHIPKQHNVEHLIQGLPDIKYDEFRDICRDDMLFGSADQSGVLPLVLDGLDSHPMRKKYIDREQFDRTISQAWVNEIPDHDLDMLFREADVDGDGKVSQNDIASMFCPPRLPGVPEDLEVNAGEEGSGAQMMVCVEPPFENGSSAITSYRVTCTPGKSSAALGAWSSADSSTLGDPGIMEVRSVTSPIKINGLQRGQSYSFRVSAINSAGEGETTDESDAVLVPLVPPPPTASPKLVKSKERVNSMDDLPPGDDDDDAPVDDDDDDADADDDDDDDDDVPPPLDDSDDELAAAHLLLGDLALPDDTVDELPPPPDDEDDMPPPEASKPRAATAHATATAPPPAQKRGSMVQSWSFAAAKKSIAPVSGTLLPPGAPPGTPLAPPPPGPPPPLPPAVPPGPPPAS
jgi:Ca2+-binding EF-hand superfamily protein